MKKPRRPERVGLDSHTYDRSQVFYLGNFPRWLTQAVSSSRIWADRHDAGLKIPVQPLHLVIDDVRKAINRMQPLIRPGGAIDVREVGQGGRCALGEE